MRTVNATFVPLIEGIPTSSVLDVDVAGPLCPNVMLNVAWILLETTALPKQCHDKTRQ